jgi:hypothetical protein
MGQTTSASILLPIFILGGFTANATSSNLHTSVTNSNSYVQTYSSIQHRDVISDEELGNAHKAIASLLDNLKSTPVEFENIFLENIEDILA